jgi:hypothetical protein
MKLIDILNELYNTPQSIKNKQKELEDLGYTKIGVGDNGIVMQKKSDVKKLTTDVDELEHAEKLVNHSFSCIIPIYKVEILPGGETGVIDMTDAQQLTAEERSEIEATKDKVRKYLEGEEKAIPKVTKELEKFIEELKKAFEQTDIDPGDIDWKEDNIMKYGENYVLVDV